MDVLSPVTSRYPGKRAKKGLLWVQSVPILWRTILEFRWEANRNCVPS